MKGGQAQFQGKAHEQPRQLGHVDQCDLHLRRRRAAHPELGHGRGCDDQHELGLRRHDADEPLGGPGIVELHVAYGYDQNGNKLSQTVPMSGYSQNNANVATTNYAYDYANRLTSATEPNSFATTNGYDELSRLTGAQGSGNSSATNTTYNNLGWVLQKVDADGVTDSKTYNTDGCVTAV